MCCDLVVYDLKHQNIFKGESSSFAHSYTKDVPPLSQDFLHTFIHRKTLYKVLLND